MQVKLLVSAAILMTAGLAHAQPTAATASKQITGFKSVPSQGYARVAPPQQIQEVSTVSSFLTRNKVTIGSTVHQETYEEFRSDNGSKIMQEQGYLAGITIGAEHKVNNISKIEYQGTLLSGSSEYTGSYQGGSYGDLVSSGASRVFVDVQATYKFSPSSWNGVTVGTGLGYRNLVDNLQELGLGGYRRENSNFYATLGVEKAFHLADRWQVTPGVVLKKSLRSHQYSDIVEDVRLIHTQKDMSGTELTLAFTRQNDNGTKFSVKPYLRTWKAADSNVVQGYLEPENTTREVGLTIGVQY
jgi:hypothetical protein